LSDGFSRERANDVMAVLGTCNAHSDEFDKTNLKFEIPVQPRQD
jgi:hypothetical protein